MTRFGVRGYDEVHRVDCGSGVAIVALHAVLNGRSFGGIRIREYETEKDALDDALLLSRAMSRKVIMAGIPGGGGKAVLMKPKEDRATAVRKLGEFIESLQGRYFCGADLGFTREDDEWIREGTSYVACGDLAPFTAQSVEIAMRAVADPKVVAIQGLGGVGRPLAESLKKAGVRVIAADVRPVEGFETVSPENIYDVECDVFAPCAMGGVLNAETIPRLKSRVVCGGANNPLASDQDADLLHKRGILYVPDFLSNAGATVKGASTSVGEEDRIDSRMKAIGDLAREVTARSREEDRSPHHVAVEMADRRIEEQRKTR